VLLDALLDPSKLFDSEGSFVSSAANFHADSEVGPANFVVRRFATARRPEFERHLIPSRNASSIRAMSVEWKILSRPTGV